MLDAGILLAAEDRDDDHHAAAVRLLELGEPLATIDLAAYETVNVAIRRWHDPEAADRLRGRVFAIAEYGQLVRVDRELAVLSQQIAGEYDISAYDSAYVAASRKLGAPLASCDQRDLVNNGLASLPSVLASTRSRG